MKLTDSQLVILSSAAKREGGAILPLPKSVKLNKGATTIVLKSLLKHKLVDERAAMPNEACWREADHNRFVLVISGAGLKALGIETADVANQAAAPEGDPQAHGAKHEKSATAKKNTPVRGRLKAFPAGRASLAQNRRDHRRGGGGDGLAAPLHPGRHQRRAQEEDGPDGHGRGQRGSRAGLSNHGAAVMCPQMPPVIVSPYLRLLLRQFREVNRFRDAAPAPPVAEADPPIDDPFGVSDGRDRP
jgi:hypothetical protein